MKKLRFLSNLVYGLRKRMGWCPEPPTPKDVIYARMAQNKRMPYVEKPSISLWTLIAPTIACGAALFVWLVSQHAVPRIPPAKREAVEPIISFVYLMIYFGLVSGFLWPVPFMLKREIHITSNNFHVRFGFFKDNIPFHEIESIERVERRPSVLCGIGDWCSGPDGWLTWAWGFFPIGVAKIKGVKWYVFGMGHTYFKVNRRNGNAVCVGSRNPELFLEGVTVRFPDIRIIRHGYLRLEKEVSEEEARELYDLLLYTYTTIYGHGKRRLELEIESLIEQGLRREEAIYRLAQKERLIEGE